MSSLIGEIILEQQELRSQSLQALFGRLGGEIGQLVRNEIALAQHEMGAKVKSAAFGVALFAVAAIVSIFALFALVVTAIAALAIVLQFWAAALIVAVALLLLAGILALVGKARISKAVPPVPERTIESLREDVQWVKTRVGSTGR
jgi:uncharacterized membrane protein YqjE